LKQYYFSENSGGAGAETGGLMQKLGWGLEPLSPIASAAAG